jgi:hypothetical protein
LLSTSVVTQPAVTIDANIQNNTIRFIEILPLGERYYLTCCLLETGRKSIKR